MSDVTNLEFWRDVRPNDVVVLSDAQALVEAIRQGLDGDGGLNYEVKRILRIQEQNELGEWQLFRLEGADEVWLMVKASGGQLDLRVYFEVPEFPDGNRADLITAEMYWLFEDPGPDWDSRYNDLRFAANITIDQAADDSNPPTTTGYQQKPFGAQYGGYTEQPQPPGADTLPATVVEYTSNDSTDNPELLLLELGGKDDPEGGYISMLLGCPIDPSEVKVFKQ